MIQIVGSIRKENIYYAKQKKRKKESGEKRRGDQDGRIGRCWAHLPHHGHIKQTSPCGSILTEKKKWETGRKTLNNQGYKKIHTESGRKRREMIRSGPVSLEVDTEEEGDYMGSEIPWEWAVWTTYWVGVLGSNARRMSPLSWFKNQWDWQWGFRKPRLHSWRVHTCWLTPPKKCRGNRLKLLCGPEQFPAIALAPTLAQGKHLLWPLHNATPH